MEDIFYTDNSKKFSKKLEPGQCMGMSCDWAVVTLKLPTVHLGALNSGKWDIGQSAYEMGQSQTDQKIIEAFGLDVESEVHQGVANGAAVAAQLLSLGQGVYVWGVVDNGGHAMGYQRTADGYEFFDPNYGLQRATGSDALRDEVVDRMDNYYSDLLGTIDIYKVKLP